MSTPKHHDRGQHWLGLLAGALSLILIAAAASWLAIHRRSGIAADSAQRNRAESAGRTVDVAVVTESAPERTVTLIGETRAYYSVTLYARVSGYLDQLLADIGDRVTQGQLLAHVESPEQDQAYNSARADSLNKRRIAARASALLKRKLISQQQADQAVADADVSEANLRTQGVIRDYQDIRAPFDGTISNRFVDLGWLLQNASGSQSASQPLFTVSKTDRLRVFMYVDQKDAAYVKAGDQVAISLAGQSQEKVQARVAMVAAELDPRTRTLLTESVIDNPGGHIVAGSFVQAAITLQMPRLMKLPVQALVMRENHPFVMVIESGGGARYAPIELEENDGESLLIRSGVKPGEKVAVNVGDTVAEGQKLHAAPTRPTQSAGQAGGGHS